MDNINILVEAKKEYTSQLQKILRPRIYEGFKSIYEDILNLSAKELEEKKIQSSSVIKTFQKMLKEIPQWNQEMIKNEYNRIVRISNCDYFENLIEAVFIANIKILTSVQINNNTQNININIPQASHFMHKCYIKSANEIYKNPYLFDTSKNLTPGLGKSSTVLITCFRSMLHSQKKDTSLCPFIYNQKSIRLCPLPMLCNLRLQLHELAYPNDT